MTTYKGLDGFIALGGALTGTPLVNATLTTGATECVVTGGGSTLTGILCLGDVFTFAGETDTPKHRITTSCYAATGTAILTTVPFEPGVSEEIAVDASLTVQSNSVAQARLWNLTAEPEILDSTVLGDAWRTLHADATALGTWSGAGECFLDMADEEQASLINAIASPEMLFTSHDVPFNVSNWYADGPPVITTGQADYSGGTTGVLIEDDDAGSVEYVYTTANFATDGEKSAGVYIKEGTASNVQVRLRAVGIASRHAVNVQWVDNEPKLTSAVGGGTLFPPESVGSGWWLVKFSATACLASNQNSLQLTPGSFTTNTDVGTMVFAGGKASDAPFPGSQSPPAAPTVALLFGVATDKQFYGFAKMAGLQITAQKGDLVTVSFSFTGTGAIKPDWV